MPPLTSSNHTGKTPSSIPNSKLVSHWIASWSWGTSWTTSRSSASRRASYAGSRAPWCSGTTNALIGDGGVGVAERLEAHVLGARAVLEPDARQRPPAVRRRRHDFEPRLRGEDGQLPDDPVGARARLAVGHTAQAVAELACERGEHGLRAGQRHAADEVGAARAHAGPSSSALR